MYRRLKPSTWVSCLILSFSLSAALVCGSKIVFGATLRTHGLSQNYMRPFGALDLLVGVVLATLIFALSLLVPRVYDALAARRPSCWEPTAKRMAAVWVAVTAGFTLAWLPMLLTYAPGGLNVDALFSLHQAFYAGTRYNWNNHHPVAFAFLLKLLIAPGVALGNLNAAIATVTIFQMLVLAGTFAYFLVWLAKRGISLGAIIVFGLFLAFFPVFQIFSVSISKDALFAALVLLYSLHLVDIVRTDGALLRTRRGALVFVALSLLSIFMRNNGFLLVLGAGLGLALVLRRRVKTLYVVLAAVILFTAVVQGPVYRRVPVMMPVLESLGIPLQQMGYVIVTDGKMTDIDREFLFRAMPREAWLSEYAPFTVDPIKGAHQLDKRFLAHNRKQFVKTWVSLLVRNPGAYARAYLLETFGYWKPFIGVKVGLPPPFVAKNEFGIVQTDLLKSWIGFSPASAMKAMARSSLWRVFLNAGVLVWLAFLIAAVLVAVRRPRFVVGLIPVYASWLGVMLASPLAFTYRYLLMYTVCFPFIVLLPIVALRDGGTAEEPATVAIPDDFAGSTPYHTVSSHS